MTKDLMTGNCVTMSSEQLAEILKIEHNEFRKKANALAARAIVEFREESSHNPAGGRPRMVMHFDKRNSMVIAAKLNDQLLAAVVDRWMDLESRQPVTLPTHLDTARMLVTSLEENARVTKERDIAIATKAEIGSRREATAMATASAAKRKVRKLEAELGFNSEHATVTAVERATGQKLPRNTFAPLRRWCRENSVQPASVADARYGSVKAWPAGAWMDVYCISLSALFPQEPV